MASKQAIVKVDAKKKRADAKKKKTDNKKKRDSKSKSRAKLALRKRKRNPPIALDVPIVREITIHLHKHLFGLTFKQRAPRAIKVVREYAKKMMHTKDVRIETSLNQRLWAKGIKNVPRRVRVRFQRERSKDEDAEEKMYTLASAVESQDYKGLGTLNHSSLNNK
jgi:large subunit ribosomal protein L31e